MFFKLVIIISFLMLNKIDVVAFTKDSHHFRRGKPHSATPPLSIMTASPTRLLPADLKHLIVKIIEEVERELAVFFREKKRKRNGLTGEDVLYLETMLATALGSTFIEADIETKWHAKSDVNDGLGELAGRFLRDFFLLKTRRQMELTAESLALIQAMTSQALSRAKEQIQEPDNHDQEAEDEYYEDDEEEDGETDVDQSPVERFPVGLSSDDSVEVVAGPSPSCTVFDRDDPIRRAQYKRNTDGQWLRSRRLPTPSTGSSSPLTDRGLFLAKLTSPIKLRNHDASPWRKPDVRLVIRIPRETRDSVIMAIRSGNTVELMGDGDNVQDTSSGSGSDLDLKAVKGDSQDGHYVPEVKRRRGSI